jgi:hypothetical protein
LGKFTRSDQSNNPEDIIIDWKSYHYNTEVDQALHKHAKTLKALVFDTKSSDIPEVAVEDAPVLSLYQETDPRYQIPHDHFYATLTQKYNGPCPTYFCGGLSHDDQARILNWIHCNISKIPSHPPHYFDACQTHARTLVLAQRCYDRFLKRVDQGISENEIQHSILRQAWLELVQLTGKTFDGEAELQKADVDEEALRILEAVMFDRSERAGAAGNTQWGLDVGPHEDLWWPYDSPENDADLRKGTESELEVSIRYSLNY